MLTSRNACSVDEPFLFHLYTTIRKAEFSMLPLNEQLLQTLLTMQYDAQRKFYDVHFPIATHEIICFEHMPIGRMLTDIQQQSIHLIDISLLPKFRGKGYGTKLLTDLQQEAARQQLPITLHVFIGNPAIRLYERCGFYVTAEITPYLAMRYEPSCLCK